MRHFGLGANVRDKPVSIGKRLLQGPGARRLPGRQDDAQRWTELLVRDSNVAPLTVLELPEPVTARYFRIAIRGTVHEGGRVGIREVWIK